MRCNEYPHEGQRSDTDFRLSELVESKRQATKVTVAAATVYTPVLIGRTEYRADHRRW